MIRYAFYFLNIIFYLLSVALWVIITEEVLINSVVLGISLLMSLIFILINREYFSKLYQSNFFKEWVNTFVRVFFLFTIFGLMNYLLFKNPTLLDFSKRKVSTLTNQTQTILKSMDSKVSIKLFARKKEMIPLIALIDLYRYHLPDLEFEVFDIDIRADLVKAHKVIHTSTVIIDFKGKVHKAVIQDELSLTNAFLEVSRENPPVIYWLRGHGELALEGKEKYGGSYLKGLMFQSSYQVRPLNLIESKKIPDDITILAIIGPQQSFHEDEIKIIKTYLERKGRVIFAIGPTMDSHTLEKLREIPNHYGVTLDNNFVVDQISNVNGSSGTAPVIKKYSTRSPITKDFQGSTFFPLVSSVSLRRIDSDFGTGELLAYTSGFPASWAERNTNELITGKVVFHEGTDIKGPIGIAASWAQATADKNRTKFIVIGNSSFLQNSYQRVGANYSFFMNSLAWLSDDRRLHAFSDVLVSSDPVIVSSILQSVIFYWSVLFTPLILFGMSFYFFQRRRRL